MTLIALIDVYSHKACTLKDVAGGYGTAFEIGDSVGARLLQAAKSKLISLPSPTMGYLATRIQEAGARPQVYSLRRTDQQWDAIPRADAAVLLSSIVDCEAEAQVVRELRRAAIPVVVVGVYASRNPDLYTAAGATVIEGEAENLSPEALRNALFGGPARKVFAGFVADLDSLPFPSWDLFPVERYRYAMLSTGGHVAPLQGARGCSFGCGYCPFRVTSPFRERSPTSIEREAIYLRDQVGARAIAFRDPLFNLNADRVSEIAARLAPLGLPFSAEMRADRLTPPLIKELAGAGLRSLEIGVESANLELLRKAKRKPPSHEQVEMVVREAAACGIRVIANFMIGLPDDTRESIEETLLWAKSLNPFAVQFTVATPYPGTTLESWADPDRAQPNLMTGWNPTLLHPSLGPDALHALREKAYVQYHFRPKYIWRFVREMGRATLSRC